MLDTRCWFWSYFGLRVGKRLLPPLANRHSARRGTYRVICRIDDAESTATIVDVDHCNAVYRPR